MQKILGSMRKAIEEFHMIDDGDKIAVALSGGERFYNFVKSS